VALVAKELERHLAGHANSTLAEDARLIREQVGRCRAILDQMAGGTGAAAGEELRRRSTVEVLADSPDRRARREPPVRST
jgi:hypothetical protein